MRSNCGCSLRDACFLTLSFKFHIETIEAKFKLSQNRSVEDRKGIIEGLMERTDDMSKLVRTMMVENENNK